MQKFDVAAIDAEYMDCVSDLLNHETVNEMENFKQHGDTDCLRHSINVSYCSYLLSKRLGLDYRAAARGGLLHDLYLYDWHCEDKPYTGFHGMQHPRIALKNANKHFNLTQCEQDIIRKHMWPLTISLPMYKESYVVTATDKYCALMEFCQFVYKTVKGKALAFSRPG